jgi:hypothetical protein
MRPLASVARQYGFAYMQRNPENAVELVLPGQDIVFRPGSRIYWINGSPDATDIAPAYRNRDVYVSNATVRVLAQIARSSAKFSPQAAAPARPDAPGNGPLTVTAVGGKGAETLSVYGSAPPGAVVHISLFAQISRDLPTVLLNRSIAVASAEGKYAATVPLAPNYFRDSIVNIDVASDSGQTASTTYVVGPPNPDVNLPAADSINGP